MLEAWRVYFNRWISLRPESINRKIFTAIFTVAGFHVLVSIVTAGKDLIVAYEFGTSDAMDAFFVAYLMPSFIVNIVTGSFHAAFIPAFIKTREEKGLEAAGRLFSNILGWYLVLLLLLCVLMFLMSLMVLPKFGAGFNSEKLELSQSLFFIFIPSLIICGLTKAWGSVINAGERFALPSFSPAIIHVSTIIFLLVFGKSLRIYALAGGMLVGLFLETCVLAWAVKSYGYRVVPKLNRMDDSIKRIVGQYFPMIIGLLLMGSTAFIDQAMAATIGPGSVSALNYGNKVVQLILGIGSVSLSTAIFPHFSKMVAQKNWGSIVDTLKTYTGLILLVTIPFTGVLFFYSEPLVRLIFERGAFLPKDTVLVGKVQGFYLLQIPFYMTGMLFVRLLSAFKKNHILMIIGGVNLITNILGNYFFVRYWGVAGISLSTSLVYVLSTVLLTGALNHQLRRRPVLRN